MFNRLFLSLALILIAAPHAPALAQSDTRIIESITLEGAPIATKHLQFGDENFNERHTMGILKVHTNGYGNWGLYALSPNSVDDDSYGVGYVTDPYVIPFGGTTALELSGAIGLVTGYQDYPLPLLAAQARLSLYERGGWNAGVAMAASPYYAKDRNTDENELGVVVTSPFLSVRYSFQ